MIYYITIDSPIGLLYVVEKNQKITRIDYTDTSINGLELKESSLLLEASKQLLEYFSGNRKVFTLPLDIEGTNFQTKVWQGLLQIPYGTTWSYSDLACYIDNDKAVRAVGQANRRNPIPIIIPCHRVVGKNKQLVGYSGNRTDLQEILLKIEGVFT
ncbi:methylated-DNA--[protein]-cysteine S-methyltransferase [Bacillus sp. HMF5848]|uniref:methylated-DNA--[protein]-cysteine S-methyltransferase n=1 Tax=Bacillus sp. HMF5848 TaxID=2495421 RepID=UPI000F78C81C|nr:methylated-DNA--[protein]-cysteine S-methyltransferase [Bacillus sp. HMF5848]RSK26712.1 methylated-DNA--[protein]-cysteine S-methyltransferase [Bacillus sp. HMF5848]